MGFINKSIYNVKWISGKYDTSPSVIDKIKHMNSDAVDKV